MRLSIYKLFLLTLALFTFKQGHSQEMKYTAPMYVQACNNQITDVYSKHNEFVNLINQKADKTQIDTWKKDFDNSLKQTLSATKKAKKYKEDDSYAKALRTEVEYMNSKEHKENLEQLLAILKSDEWQNNKAATNPKYKEIESLYNIRKTAMDALAAKRTQVHNQLKTTYPDEFAQYFCDEWDNLIILSKSSPTGQPETSSWGMRYRLSNQFLGRFNVYALTDHRGKNNGRFMVSLGEAANDQEVQATFNDAKAQLTNCSFIEKSGAIHGYSQFSPLYKFPFQKGDYIATIVKNKYKPKDSTNDVYEVALELSKYDEPETLVVQTIKSDSPKTFQPDLISNTAPATTQTEQTNGKDISVPMAVITLSGFLDLFVSGENKEQLTNFLLPSFVEQHKIDGVKKKINTFLPVSYRILGNVGNRYHVAVWGKDKGWIHEVWFQLREYDGKVYIDPTGVNANKEFVDPWVELKQWSDIKID